MEDTLERALRVYWNRHSNTNDELVAFAATLNPPISLVPGTTTEMLNALIDHVDQENIILIRPVDGNGFIQQTNITETGEPPGQVDPDSQQAPAPLEGAKQPPDQQLEGEGIPGPEEDQEQPARDEAYDHGGPDPALVGAGAPTPPESPLTPTERIEDMEEVFDKLEELLKLPPANQNFITPLQREQHEKGSVLIAQGRLLLSDAE